MGEDRQAAPLRKRNDLMTRSQDRRTKIKAARSRDGEELRAARALADAVADYITIIRYVPSSVCIATQCTPTVGNRLVDAYEDYRRVSNV